MFTQPDGITVIIASYNRPEIFQTVFKSYLTDDKVNEFIFINDGSTMDYKSLQKVLNAYCEKNQIHFIYIENKKRKGAPACRNIGLKNAGGRYVFFSDDDMYLGEGTMGHLLDTLKGKKAQAAGCRIYYLSMEEYQNNISTWPQYADNVESISDPIKKYSLTGLFSHKIKNKIVPVEFVSGTVMYDHNFLKDKNIRFYENYQGNAFREETDPQIQLRKKGGVIIFCSEYLCFHLPYEMLNNSGQRRAGKIWYEFWIFVNNLIFYRRHSRYFKKKLRLSLFKYLYHFNKDRFTMLIKKFAEKYGLKKDKKY